MNIDLLMPTLSEVEILLGCSLDKKNFHAIEQGVSKLLAHGVPRVIISNAHETADFSQDYWADGKQKFWITSKRNSHATLSASLLAEAIKSLITTGYAPVDAVVMAKAYINQNSRLSQQFEPLTQQNWLISQEDLPWITSSAEQGMQRPFFQKAIDLGFYLIVDSFAWLERLLPCGIKTFQLRIKNKPPEMVEQEIKKSIALAKKYQAKLFINDYWELAIKHNAYGVHLGQEDSLTADIHKISQTGLYLGVSTHCYYEVARAHALQPSYIACGPIFPTTSKKMPCVPQGITNLKYWRKLLEYPLVAIGGISLDNVNDILSCGVESVAVISAVLNNPHPEQIAKQFLQCFEKPVSVEA